MYVEVEVVVLWCVSVCARECGLLQHGDVLLGLGTHLFEQHLTDTGACGAAVIMCHVTCAPV